MTRENRTHCRCAHCRDAVAALALNLLPPHYYAEPYRETENGSPWLMVETAVAEAIDRIAQNPDHTLTPALSAENRPFGRRLERK